MNRIKENIKVGVLMRIKMNLSYTVLLGVALVSISGCESRNNEQVLAEVNGNKVTETQLQAYLTLKRIPVDQKKRVDDAFNRLLEREILSTKILQEEALDASVLEMEVDEFRRQMVISRYFENYLNKAVPDDAIHNYYTANSDRYKTRQANVAHILLRTNPKMSDQEKQALLTTISEAYSKIQLGEPFEKIAEQYSNDTISAKKGGSLGWIKQGAIDPKFSNTAFNMKTGEVSKPFETPYGYHIVKLIEGPKEVLQPFDSVKGDIRYQLRNEAKNAEMARLIKSSSVRRFDGDK
jgi:peptidyl-prolyl cis-trans isomerase C